MFDTRESAVQGSAFGRNSSGFAIWRTGTLMPLHESEAIILKCYSLGEADRLVSFLSRSMGCLRGVAKGARKPKSRFGATLESLSHIRIWFFERENKDLVRVTQCEMIESFLDAFSDYSSGVALSLFSEITESVLPEREASDPSFRLLLLAAQTVKKTSRPEVPLAYFSLWTVKLGGWMPSLEGCSRCGKVLAPSDPAYFSSGAVACADCRRPGMRTMSPHAVEIAREMLRARLDRLKLDAIPPRHAREVTDVMLDIIERQIDRRLAARQLLELPT